MGKKTNNLYAFDIYLINVRERNLWCEGNLVQISPKVFDLLLLLVEKNGEIISKEEIIESLWKDSFVKESNISQNIYTLRQLLGNDKKFIETVSKKGYRFVESVKFLSDEITTSVQTDEVNLNSFKNETVKEIKSGNFTVSIYNRKWASLAIVIALLCVAGVFGLNYYYTSPKIDPISITSLEIKSLTDTGDVFPPSISPDGKFVAYVKKLDSDYKLHLKDVESNNDVEINIENDVKIGFISFAPDGKRIFFRTRGSHLSAQKIYEVSYFGGAAKLVAENVWGYFSFSLDGENLAFYRDLPTENKQQLILKNLSSGEENIAIERQFPNRMFLSSSPVWSPDSKRIATIPIEENPNRSKINIIDLQTSKETILETDLHKIWQFEWMPDGKHFFALVREEEKGWQMWQIELQNGKSQKITNDLNSYQKLSATKDGRSLVLENRMITSNIHFFPNADLSQDVVLTGGNFGHFGIFALDITANGKILFDGRSKLRRDLWVINPLTKSRQHLYENNSAFVFNLSSTKDSKYVYFVSDLSKFKTILRIDIDSKKSESLNLDENLNNLTPSLSSDEKWLYFIKQTENSNEIWRQSLTTSQQEKILEPRNFTFGNFLSISPDGKYAAFHYLDKQNETENSAESQSGKTKIGFLNLNDLSDIKVREINTTNRFIVWSHKSDAFDYIENSSNAGQIKRLSLTDETKSAETVFSSPKKQIFRFAWSSDGKDLVVAQGENQSNAVMLKFTK